MRVPEAPGLGVELDVGVLREHLVPLTIDTGVAHAHNDAAPGRALLYSTAGLLPPAEGESRAPEGWSWAGIDVTRVPARGGLSKPLLLLVAAGGYVGCGLFNMEASNALGEVAAVVRGVDTPEDVLARPVTAVSEAAAALGVAVGMSGAAALDLMRAPPAKL